MQKKMQVANLPKPVFLNEREDFVVTFYNGEYPEKVKNAQEKSEKRTRKIQESDILNFCIEAKSLKEIVEHFGYKNVRNFRENYIKPLIASGTLEMTIPNNPKNRKQKYISNK